MNQREVGKQIEEKFGKKKPSITHRNSYQDILWNKTK
tara:strand:- start:263 stop:373 length:111 start_codon:yes stop_codon:yes gene_type:complete